MSKNKEKIKSKKINIFIIIICVAVSIVLGLILFFILKKKDPHENDAPLVFETETMENILLKDKDGNIIKKNMNTGETTIITDEDLTPEQLEEKKYYESKNAEYDKELNIAKANLDDKYSNGDIELEEYDKLYKEAVDRKVAAMLKDKYVPNQYVLVVSKEIFNNLNQEKFMQKLTFIYKDFKASVDVDLSSYDDEKNTEMIFYVSGFKTEDYDNVLSGLVEAFGTNDFTFVKK